MAHLTALLALAGLLLGAAPSASAPASPPAPAAAPAPPAAAPLLVAPAATRAPADVASFTRHSRFVDVQLSPKGTWLAMISMEGGKQTLSFVKLADRSGASRLTPSADSMVGGIMWVNDERLVASLALADGTLASPSFTGELLAVDPVGAANKRIFGYRAGASAADTRTKKRGPDLAAGFLIGKAPGDDRSVLVATRDLTESGDRKMRVIKLDVYGGNQGDVMLAPTLNAEFVTDERHEIRGAESIDSKGRREAFERVPGGWKPLTARAGVTALSELQGWRSGAGRLLVSEKEGDGWGLYEVALEGGARTRIGQTRLAPPSRVLRDKATGQVLAVESQPDLPDWQILVPEHPLSQVLSGLLDAYPGQNVVIYSTTEDQKLAVAFVYSDRNPGQFLLVDVAARKAEPLLETRPWVKAEASAEVAAFHIKASDGQLIHGYVTYPPDLAPGARAPVVVMPHGGPHGPRDVWGYFPDAQLLASRGYAVLQVNFRGSGGYGLDYERAGYQRWGDRIMDDILDATRWLVGKGKVDAGRMCTYGGSFGGYSALQLVARAPETFRCAVGYAGVYDLQLLEGQDEWVTSAFTRDLMRTYLGNDAEQLKAFSPAFHVDRIKVPVFLIHGKKDIRAEYRHAELMRKALTDAGRPPEWLVEPLEAHGFYDEGARLRMYTALLAFLDRHTAPAAAAPAPASGATTAPGK